MKKNDVVQMAVFLPLSGWCHRHHHHQHHHHPDVTWMAVISSCIPMIWFESFCLQPLSFKSFSRPTCCSPNTVFFQNGGNTRRKAILCCRVPWLREDHHCEDAVRWVFSESRRRSQEIFFFFRKKVFLKIFLFFFNRCSSFSRRRSSCRRRYSSFSRRRSSS